VVALLLKMKKDLVTFS